MALKYSWLYEIISSFLYYIRPLNKVNFSNILYLYAWTLPWASDLVMTIAYYITFIRHMYRWKYSPLHTGETRLDNLFRVSLIRIGAFPIPQELLSNCKQAMLEMRTNVLWTCVGKETRLERQAQRRARRRGGRRGRRGRGGGGGGRVNFHIIEKLPPLQPSITFYFFVFILRRIGALVADWSVIIVCSIHY